MMILLVLFLEPDLLIKVKPVVLLSVSEPVHNNAMVGHAVALDEAARG